MGNEEKMMNINELEKWTEAQGIDCEDLDDFVHECASELATTAYNGGIISQLEFLWKLFDGGDQVRKELREYFNIKIDMLTMVEARVHSDDHVVEANFNAIHWLATATTKEIQALNAYDWGGALAADQVALHMQDLDQGVADVISYVEILSRFGSSVGFECWIKKEQALTWLKNARPEVYDTLNMEA